MNQRPLGYEPNELPDCSTPRSFFGSNFNIGELLWEVKFFLVSQGLFPLLFHLFLLLVLHLDDLDLGNPLTTNLRDH